jgi:hypothetical protein
MPGAAISPNSILSACQKLLVKKGEVSSMLNPNETPDSRPEKPTEAQQLADASNIEWNAPAHPDASRYSYTAHGDARRAFLLDLPWLDFDPFWERPEKKPV